MNTYDPQVIQRYADRLYARTTGVIVVSTVLGVIVGAAADPFIQQALPVALSTQWPQWASPLALGIIGFLQGTEKAAALKIQAQTALCQMQIELNTRKSSGEPITPTKL